MVIIVIVVIIAVVVIAVALVIIIVAGSAELFVPQFPDLKAGQRENASTAFHSNTTW